MGHQRRTLLEALHDDIRSCEARVPTELDTRDAAFPLALRLASFLKGSEERTASRGRFRAQWVDSIEARRVLEEREARRFRRAVERPLQAMV